jgi:RNA polymerase sigma-70 factor (ECF subfamily)
MDSLTSLIHEDAMQSMPPYELWLRGRDEILAFWQGQGAACAGSRLLPTVANGRPAFGQYRRNPAGDGYHPWALQILEFADGELVELSFFLDTETLFPLFGLPPHLDA